MKCKIKDCDREVCYKKTRVCSMHYQRMWAYGRYDSRRKKAKKPRRPKAVNLLEAYTGMGYVLTLGVTHGVECKL